MTLQCAIRKELITREQPFETGSGVSVAVIGMGSRPGTLGGEGKSHVKRWHGMKRLDARNWD